jgi:hypothetical protein
MTVLALIGAYHGARRGFIERLRVARPDVALVRRIHA